MVLWQELPVEVQLLQITFCILILENCFATRKLKEMGKRDIKKSTNPNLHFLC
jgi:hypothetical protein